MPVELRKPQLFYVVIDSGDDNDNYRTHEIHRAYDFEQVTAAFTKATCESRHADGHGDSCNPDMSYGDDQSYNVWHDELFECESCAGTGHRCNNWDTHEAYTNDGCAFVECKHCQECIYCGGSGTDSIPLHDTITIEEVSADDPHVDVDVDLIDD